MDIVKNIILFFVFALLSYVVFNNINITMEQRAYRWEQKLTLELEVIRDFELGFRNFKSSTHEIFNTLYKGQSDQFDQELILNFISSFSHLETCSNSLVYWLNGVEKIDIDKEVSEFIQAISWVKKTGFFEQVDVLKDVYEGTGNESSYQISLEKHLENVKIFYYESHEAKMDSLFYTVMSKIRESKKILLKKLQKRLNPVNLKFKPQLEEKS